MGKITDKLVDWKNRLKDRHMLSVIVVLFTIIVLMGVWIYKKQVEYRQASENQYQVRSNKENRIFTYDRMYLIRNGK